MEKNSLYRLGDYIREVDVRNRDLEVTNLLGLSMTKQFRPSTSNIVGVDLSKYKVVHKNVSQLYTLLYQWFCIITGLSKHQKRICWIRFNYGLS